MRIPNPRLSRRGYVVLTIAGILLPTLFLSFLALHFVQRHYRFQGQILEEYSRFSAEYAAAEIERVITTEERDIATYLQLAALLDPFRPEAELGRAEAIYPLIEHAFLLRTDGDLVLAPPIRTTASDSLPVTARAVGRDPQRARAERLVRHVLDPAALQHVLLSGAVHYYAGEEGGAPYQLTAFPFRDAHDVDRGVIGFFLDTEYVRHQLVGRVLDTTIHAAEGRFAPDFGTVLTLVVRDENDREVYTHRHVGDRIAGARPACPSRDLARASLEDVIPGWKVGITYASPSGFGWMRRVVGLQLALLLLAAALVVAGTIVTMRFGLRQMELSRVKSHFVSNITHELKTPLAAIRLYTETLQQGRVHDRAEADRFLGVIHKETVRLTALINNILDFARIEDAQRRYRFAPASVGTVVSEVVDAYAYQLRNRGFELHLEVETGLPDIAVDRDAIAQALLNLLDNAVKYSRDVKEIGVEVRREGGLGAAGADRAGGADDATGVAASAAGGGGAILVQVRDRGIGIAAAEQRRIFDAFYRVEKGLEHDVKGSGLGLAVVKHIAEAHGGSVEIESRTGSGSTFTLRLPVGAASRGEASGGAGEASSETSGEAGVAGGDAGAASGAASSETSSDAGAAARASRGGAET